MSQSSYFKSRHDLLTLGEFEGEIGNLGKRLRVETSGGNLMGKISSSSRYVIDIIGTNPFSLEELGGVNLEN